MQINDHIAIVTGAGSGIGRAIALGLAGEGAVVVVADIVPEKAEQVAEEVHALKVKSMAYRVDVADSQQVEKMADAVLREYGQIDILINDAGYAARARVVDMTDEEWDRTIAVNLRGTFLCSRAVLKPMMARRYGKIVNVASGLGIRGSPDSAAYGASKAGVINFTRSLAEEVAGYGINVNAIAPGVTDTLFLRRVQPPEQIEAMLRTGRIGQPEDLVSTVIFLCSEAGKVITGQTIQRDIFMGVRI